MTIVTIVSWLIMVFVGVVTVFCIFEEKDIKKQMNAALVLLPIEVKSSPGEYTRITITLPQNKGEHNGKEHFIN